MNETEIAEQFGNKENMYYGHGIGADNPKVIDSIFKNGLRCSHERLFFTTIAFGEGSEHLFEDQQETINNWKHKGSKQIIIASLPQKYHIINVPSGPLYGKETSAFFNYIPQEEATKLGIAQGYYLKPEFVRGVYDVNDGSFTQNDRYYENLTPEEQKELFDEVKRQYIDLLKGSQWTLAEYAEILESNGWKNPLTQEEIAQADKEVFEAEALEAQLQSVAENSRAEDFSQTTQGIKEGDLNPELDEELEYTDEGWSMDDWE